MPIYTFTCPHCNLTFEELTKNPDDEVSCPNCSRKTNKRANVAEKVAKPIVKGNSPDGTGRSYIQDGDYMIGVNAAKAHERMDERDNLKRRIMFENNTTSLQRYEVEEVDKTYTGKEKKDVRTEYAPLAGDELNNFIDGHKQAQKLAEEGGLKSDDIQVSKDMKKVDHKEE